MKILFIGCVESSHILLKELINDKENVVGVITKRESLFNSDFRNLAPLCEANQIPYYYANNINDVGSILFIKKYNPDIGFCFGWSQIIKGDVIQIFPKGIVGFHPAALPNNKGRHPLIWALALGLRETASTFFMINEKADEGDIIAQRKVTIDYKDDARALYDKVMEIAVQQEKEIVRSFEDGTVRRIPQTLNKGNIWRKRKITDGEIDWRMSSLSIYNLVRSLTKPYAGAHFIFSGHEYKVWKVKEIRTKEYVNIEPGKVLAVNEDGTVDIKAGDNCIRLIEYDSIALEEGDYIL